MLTFSLASGFMANSNGTLRATYVKCVGEYIINLPTRYLQHFVCM